MCGGALAQNTQATISSWLTAIGTLALAIIAIWPMLMKSVGRLIFPRVEIVISGKGNLVISQDGNVHKIQIPLQFENKGLSSLFIESVGIKLQDPGKTTYPLGWRLFITDLSGHATAPLTNPYRFKVESQEVEDKFVEFITEEDIIIKRGIFIVEVATVMSFASKRKTNKIKYQFAVTDKLANVIQRESDIDKRMGKHSLAGIEFTNRKVME